MRTATERAAPAMICVLPVAMEYIKIAFLDQIFKVKCWNICNKYVHIKCWIYNIWCTSSLIDEHSFRSINVMVFADWHADQEQETIRIFIQMKYAFQCYLISTYIHTYILRSVAYIKMWCLLFHAFHIAIHQRRIYNICIFLFKLKALCFVSAHFYWCLVLTNRLNLRLELRYFH